jgi:hypothetical protein
MVSMWAEWRATGLADGAVGRITAIEAALGDAVDRNFERVFSEFAAVRAELLALHRQFAQAGWALAGAVFIQLVVLVVTVSLN